MDPQPRSSRVLRFAVTSLLLGAATGCPSDPPGPITNPGPPPALPSPSAPATPVATPAPSAPASPLATPAAPTETPSRGPLDEPPRTNPGPPQPNHDTSPAPPR